MNVSIIIPIKIKFGESLEGFIAQIVTLAEQIKDTDSEIIIADESERLVNKYIKNHLECIENVNHFVPDPNIRTGANDKLNGIYDALNYVNYDNILLIDDHYRITRETLNKISPFYNRYDCFKVMPKFDKFPISAKIDLCGMFIVNLLDYRKQYCGHLAFTKELIDRVGFPNRDSLFDELALENQLRKGSNRICFLKNISLEAEQNISYRKFLEQRVRYAYENFAFPFRTLFFLSIIPIIVVLFIINITYMYYFILIVSIISILFGLLGQLVYARNIAPTSTFLLSPVWFWFYPFTTWIAVYKYLNGGVYFGGKKVRRAV
ncbi:glycosyltransferase family 2 protein [Halalkalibacter sp. APA_J-10(15)]|uniref:glycosyltransferase n=1 Tax=Halalkalibacter sp. APA_J-10(15) TaxID=2933805 RepID=UPI001FF380AC|nr:hypothetical protein [Halalkalibacter sp. APA_J-10(15)]MCK0473043.1 hypothetical protein [Halalkalibacter sp. APA_J-10(15)]